MDNTPAIVLRPDSQASPGSLERRRPGRVEYANTDLIGLLRTAPSAQPGTALFDDERRLAGRALRSGQTAALMAERRGTQERPPHNARPHRQDVPVVVAITERHCSDDRYAKNWAGFLGAEVERIGNFITGGEYPRQIPTAEAINALIARLVSMSETLRRACLVSGRWGTPQANREVGRAIRSLGSWDRAIGQYSYWAALRSFCASLCFYWALAGALARGDLETIRDLMHTQVTRASGEVAAVTALPLLALGPIEWNVLKGYEQRRMPASDFLFELLETEITCAAVNPVEAECLFDALELLISLEFSYLRPRQSAVGNAARWSRTLLGRYVCERGNDGLLERLAAYRNLPVDHLLLTAGLLGGKPEAAARAAEVVCQAAGCSS
jgi:hypothetical protein